MHDSITFATPFHPKNDLENRPFRASYISTRSQRRLSGKFGHEMGGDRCRGRWIKRNPLTIKGIIGSVELIVAPRLNLAPSMVKSEEM